MFDIIVNLVAELDNFMHNGQNFIKNSVMRSWYWFACTNFIKEQNTLITMQEDPTCDPDIVVNQEGRATEFLDLLAWVFPQLTYVAGMKTPNELVSGFFSSSSLVTAQHENAVWFLMNRSGYSKEDAEAKIAKSDSEKEDANKGRVDTINSMIQNVLFGDVPQNDELDLNDQACKGLLDQMIQSLEFILNKDTGFFTEESFLKAFGQRQVNMSGDLALLQELYPRVCELRKDNFPNEEETMEELVGQRRQEFMFQQDLTKREYRDPTRTTILQPKVKKPGRIRSALRALFG
tara:strand:+ start:288 stop:1160 length:873 start_codon:yes stop_codon:yes gene_type:complete